MDYDTTTQGIPDPLKKFLIITIGGAAASRMARSIGKKVKKEMKSVDLNKMKQDPKGETKKIAQKLGDEAKEGMQGVKKDVRQMRERGLGDILRRQASRVRTGVEDTLVGFVQEQYPYTAELKIEGSDAFIGEYLTGERVTRERAGTIRDFVRALQDDYHALPTDLTEDTDASYLLRREIITDFTGLATTDVYSLIESVEVATTKNFYHDHDPTLRRQQLETLKTYAPRIDALAKSIGGGAPEEEVEE